MSARTLTAAEQRLLLRAEKTAAVKAAKAAGRHERPPPERPERLRGEGTTFALNLSSPFFCYGTRRVAVGGGPADEESRFKVTELHY